VGASIRIGLHSGLVAFGRIPGPQHWLTAVGETVDVAAGLQQAAAHGTIVLSESTARQVIGYISLESSPLEGLGARPLTPFVGRQRDMSTLGDILSHARAGHGQVVGIAGEPGMGKSRLLLEFRNSLGAPAVACVEGRCVSYGSSTPYLPLVDLIRANSGIEPGDDSATIVAHVRSALGRAGLEPDKHLPFVARLLAVADATSPPYPPLTPEEIKAHTFQTLRAWTFKISQQRPLVVVIEDLHWIDATSEEYLTSLVESLAGSPILLLCSWRPGYQPSWAEHSYVTQLSLQRLGPGDSLAILESVRGAQPMSAGIATRMLERAEGNPFFLEELARASAGREDADTDGTLPATIEDVLLARIGALPASTRHVLQTAAVLGRDFSLGVLENVWDGGDALLPELHKLQSAEFVYQRDVAPEPRFSFKHALTHEVAYASLLGSARRRLHRRVAETLEQESGGDAHSRPELLAHHYTAAGVLEPAIAWWQRAGERALEASANVEAIRHFTQALQLLGSLPETPARVRQELELQIGLSTALIVTRGYGAEESVQADTRARDLAHRVGEPGHLLPLLFRRWRIQLVQSHQYVARQAAEDFLSNAETYGDATQMMLAHSSMGVSCLVQGEIAAGRQHLAQAWARDAPEYHRPLAFEPGAAIHTWQAIGAWLSGQSGVATRLRDDAFAAARAVDHINTLAQVLSTAGTMLAQMERCECIRVARASRDPAR
jgi:AAA ATPase domain